MRSDGIRRQKRRNRRGSGASVASVTAESTRTAEAPWDWRTFPVFFAFATGALLMGALVWIVPGAFYVFLVTALFLTIFGVMHFFGRSLREYRSGDDEG